MCVGLVGLRFLSGALLAASSETDLELQLLQEHEFANDHKVTRRTQGSLQVSSASVACWGSDPAGVLERVYRQF